MKGDPMGGRGSLRLGIARERGGCKVFGWASENEPTSAPLCFFAPLMQILSAVTFWAVGCRRGCEYKHDRWRQGR